MKTTKARIKEIIEKVISEEKEELLVNPIDHAKAIGSDPVTDEPEVIDHSTGKVVKISDRTISISESGFRNIISKMLKDRS